MKTLPRRTFAFGLVSAALLGGLSGCVLLLPDHYTFRQEQLQRALERRFPFEQRVLEIFTVQLSQPRLSLLPGIIACG